LNKKGLIELKQKIMKRSKSLSDYSRQTSRQILIQYAFSIILCFVILIALFVMLISLYYYYRRLTGDDSSIIFWIAQIARETLPFWVTVICIGVWIVLTHHFICRPLLYLDEIVAAAEKLASPSDTPVTLSPGLKNIQDNLNLVREKAIRNALLAKEAEQRKNDLVVYLAHDLKTPLTSIIGYLTLLRDEPQLSPEFRARYTDIALDKALRLEDLINEFFEITRFNLTTLSLEKEPVHLSRMLEQITSEFLPVLSEKSLTWRTEITPGVELLCDPNKMERVFDNLIRNAVNYSYPDTEILLSMKLSWACLPDSAAEKNAADPGKRPLSSEESTPDPGKRPLSSEESIPGETSGPRCVLITVSNHGKTIPADKLNRIFEQFFRLDPSRATATGGSGLGLAIAKEIVELHGGTISASSENESITFIIRLPLR